MVLDNTYSQPSLDYMRRWRMQPDTCGKHQEWRQQRKDGRKHWIEDVQKRALNGSASHVAYRPFPEQIMTALGAATSGR
jgi:hypothetical protein